MCEARTAWAGDGVLVASPASPPANPLPVLHQWRQRLQAQHQPGILNVTVGSSTLTIQIDPALPDPNTLRHAIEAALAAPQPTAATPPPRTIEIPVCYDNPAWSLDLASIAAELGAAPDTLVQKHASATYTVDFLGFAPGFAYLSGLHASLQVPRLPTPRTRLPAGSVGIAGARTAVYPCAMPGGWQIIGRSPMHLFDPNDTPPTRLQPGDHVRFRRIDADAFAHLARERSQ
ncbi:MAG: 5-oxoprolinase subunit PxpB [Phycisphaerales bacterium]|nr:5-oxoprolinase subunit PxpB [Phycisphaerales bacterium]